jgi:hypothetical protein
MSTLGNVQDRLADDLNRTDLSTQIITAINRAISHYTKEPFWFTETSSTFTTSDSAAYYTNSSPAAFPTDIARIQYAEITVNGNDYELEPWTIEEVQSANVTGTKNQPIAYAWWQNRVYTYPLANGAYPVTVYHTKSYPALTSTASSNDFTTYAEDLIEARARWWLNLRVIKDFDSATADKQEELDALSAMREKNAGYSEQNEVVPTDF